MIRTMFAAAVAVASLVSVAQATSATCTITKFIQPNLNLGLNFGVPNGIGFALPVEFTEGSGAFSVSQHTWFEQFGQPGLQFNTVDSDIHGFLSMPDGTVAGTADGNGEIALPSFPFTQTTDYLCDTCDPMNPETYTYFPVTGVDLMTGLQFRVLSGKSYVVEGTPIDFTAGSVELYGVGFLAGAPGGPGTNLSGVDITCTLSPIPSQTALPSGPTIAKITGKLKVDSGALKDGGKGDALTLKAALTPGATPFDLTGASPFILRVGGVTLLVQPNAFTVKGKKLLVKRDDTCKIKKGATSGVCRANTATTCTKVADCAGLAKLEVVEGQKVTAGATSLVSGQLLVANGKKGATVTLKLQGLDLSTVTGAQTVRLAIGRANARKAVTVSGSSLK